MNKTNTPTLDHVTLAVLQNGLNQVCNEMDLAFQRAAFSPVIAEAMDRSDGIYHRDDGALIAQGELGLPIFVGTMQFSTRNVISQAKDLQPGDIYIVNDPYLGGTHLMDVRMAMPFFYKDKIFCWLSNTGHWRDTGGAVPGGFSANATEVEQEGLRLPPVKLYKGGQLDEEIQAIVLSNIRVANETLGDIKAQVAALWIGERRLTALLDRYGHNVVEVAIDSVEVCLGAGLDDVGARALASDEITITEINFNTHFAQRVLALRHSADSVILQTPGHLGKTVDRLQRGVHRAIAHAGVLEHGFFF